jgi:hypothetical protein
MPDLPEGGIHDREERPDHLLIGKIRNQVQGPLPGLGDHLNNVGSRKPCVVHMFFPQRDVKYFFTILAVNYQV